MLTLLSELKNDNLISELNYQFAKMIDRKQQAFAYTEQQKNLAVLLAALVSNRVMQGDSCINLDGSPLHCFFDASNTKITQDYQAEILQKIGDISPLAWQDILADHIAFSQDPNHIAPMLFQHNKLYFYRYWQAENRIAKAMQQAVENTPKNANPEQDRTILDRFFPPSADSSKPDWQKIAVATALRQKFCLISGGPGTGKTTTVAKLLAVLQLKQLEQGLPLLNIALTAPTGKAASRLEESIRNSLKALGLPESIQQSLPHQAQTLHRLLGIRPNNDLPKYNAENPLHTDLLVVDETSMVDLFLMEKLFNALPPHTRLIMLGDKDQLPSVDAGNAMSELGELLTMGYSTAHRDYLRQVTLTPMEEPVESQNAPVPAICDSLCHLRQSFRFDANSGIGELARFVNDQQAGKSWQLFTNLTFNDLDFIAYPESQQFTDKAQWIQHCVKLVVDKAVECYQDYLQLVKKRSENVNAVSVGDIFTAFQKVRLLSALQISELGVERLNQHIADALKAKGLVQFHHARDSYAGKPILITENSPQIEISNGDIGLLLPDENGKLRAYFDKMLNGKLHNLSPSRLPNYEPAYVMTVHKSQGSEFEHTLMIMPLSFNPVLSKELLYTAITRAKKRFTLFGNERIWKSAVHHRVQRQSGLKAQILAMS